MSDPRVFSYACECGEPGCDARLALTQAQFAARAERGPVMSMACRITAGMLSATPRVGAGVALSTHNERSVA